MASATTAEGARRQATASLDSTRETAQCDSVDCDAEVLRRQRPVLGLGHERPSTGFETCS
eukprot:7215206-Prymnesium_polylepis.1